MKFCEEITSINKEVTNLYRNAEDEERGSSGDLGVGGVSGETFHVCECCANLIFNKTINPTRTKTVLLIGMLVDQIVHHYYNPVHEDFEKKFKMPKLLHHGPNYIAHPAWFIREDRQWVDLDLLEDLTFRGLTEFNDYFKANDCCVGWLNLFKDEVMNEFFKINTILAKSMHVGMYKVNL